MKSRATRRFWELHNQLPEQIQRLAKKAYHLWRENPQHPSLDFKKLKGSTDRFSVRIGAHYRALGRVGDEGVTWVWIGTHEEYNKLVGR